MQTLSIGAVSECDALFPQENELMVSKVHENKNNHNRKMYRIAVVSVVASALSAGAGVWVQYHIANQATEGFSTRIANIETSIRLLTAATAPQLQQAIDDSLKAALAHPNRAEGDVRLVKDAISQMNDAAVTLPKGAASTIGAQLSQLSSVMSDSQDIWNADAVFINYRSNSANS